MTTMRGPGTRTKSFLVGVLRMCLALLALLAIGPHGSAVATAAPSSSATAEPSSRLTTNYDATAYGYDNPVRGVHGRTAAVRRGPPEIAGYASSYAPARISGLCVAAKTVDDLPAVNWGQQSKHFPGHPNFIPGRSTLTANPEALIQRAGTGTPVGSVPRGQAGFKERIDFGDSIGTYVSRDGTSSPTSIGILHYRADGSVHIVPGRPQ